MSRQKQYKCNVRGLDYGLESIQNGLIYMIYGFIAWFHYVKTRLNKCAYSHGRHPSQRIRDTS